MGMKRFLLIPALIVAALPSMFALRSRASDDLLRDSIYKGMEARKSMAFVAQCGDRKGRYAVLVYDAGVRKWGMIEEEEGNVVNLTDYALTSEGITDFETNGGMYSTFRVHNLIDELAASGFDLLAPFTVEKLKALKIKKKKCRYDK